MAGLDIRCYVNAKKLIMEYDSNICAPLDSLRLLTTDRDSISSFNLNYCSFDDQTVKNIQDLVEDLTIIRDIFILHRTLVYLDQFSILTDTPSSFNNLLDYIRTI